MAQFQAYRNPRPSRDRVPFLVDVQSDLVNIGTRLVMPMVHEREFGTPLTRLNPLFTVDGERVVLSAADVAAVPQSQLREPVADLSPRRSEIISALDFLILGY